MAHHSSSLWYSTNFIELYRPAFNKPLLFYKFQSNIQPIIHKDSNILSISEHYPSQHSTSLWYYISFRAIYRPSFIKPLIFYQFQSIIQPKIQQASNLLYVSEQYSSQHTSSLLYFINFRALSIPSLNKPLIFYRF